MMNERILQVLAGAARQGMSETDLFNLRGRLETMMEDAHRMEEFRRLLPDMGYLEAAARLSRVCKSQRVGSPVSAYPVSAAPPAPVAPPAAPTPAPSASAPAVAVPEPVAAPVEAVPSECVVRHTLKTRRNPLDAVFARAKQEATDSTCPHSVWAALSAMAQGSHPPPELTDFDDAKGIQATGARNGWLPKSAFMDRWRRGAV